MGPFDAAGLLSPQQPRSGQCQQARQEQPAGQGCPAGGAACGACRGRRGLGAARPFWHPHQRDPVRCSKGGRRIREMSRCGSLVKWLVRLLQPSQAGGSMQAPVLTLSAAEARVTLLLPGCMRGFEDLQQAKPEGGLPERRLGGLGGGTELAVLGQSTGGRGAAGVWHAAGTEAEWPGKKTQSACRPGTCFPPSSCPPNDCMRHAP